MKTVFWKSAAVAFASLAASVFIALSIVPAFGGNAWLLLTICPMTLAWPASAYTFWQSERLKRAHRDLARAHAQLAAAHRRLEDKAMRDDMTGMLNRESFFAALDGSRDQEARGALLIIDADHFKSINDRFGHPVGDAALLEIAAAISRGVRGGDLLGRIGGEEFAAFLVGAGEQEASGVAERIRREVELIRFRPDGDASVPLALTVSIGGTACLPGATVSDMMRAADRRLYRAKNSGRNLAVLDRDFSEAA